MAMFKDRISLLMKPRRIVHHANHTKRDGDSWDAMHMLVIDIIKYYLFFLHAMRSRMIRALATSSVLAVFCVIGMSVRLGFTGNEALIFATVINRLELGLVVGLAGLYKIRETTRNVILRGGILGFIISGALYIASGFADLPGFFVGIVYGIIIDLVASKKIR